MKRFLSILFCLLLLFVPFSGLSVFAAPTVGAYDLFVSPDGDDAAAGTQTAPLKTPAAAKEKLKALRGTLSENERATVWLRGGRYEFSETLEFTKDDLPNMTFAAWNEEEVVFSGAQEITGFTEETANGVRVLTKTLDPAADPTGFKSLFGGDEQLPVPRYPETGYFTVKADAPEDDLWTADTTPWSFTRGQRSFYADPADLAVEFTNFEDVQVRILHYWHDELMYLTGIDRTTGKLGLSRPSSMLIRDIDRYYFENVFEALDAPGEWYLNTKENKLYYVPKEGETADSLTLKASALERLIDMDGVSGLAFEHIRFSETDWEIPSPGEWEGGWRGENDIDALQAALDVRGVVTVRHADNVRFENCEFRNLGADAVKFMNGVKNSAVESCLFRNIAATAVFIGGENCRPEDENCTANVTVKNNDISGYGRKFYCAIGVHITYCDGAEIANNEISDGYYTAISCGWNWGYTYHLTKNIHITDNLIYNIGQGWLSDMGGIYMLGVQPGTVLSGNVIHNVAADPSEGGYGGWGIYLDEGSSFMQVFNNLVYCCGSQGLNIHYGEGNVFRNNISALNAEGQVSPGSRMEETHATAFYYNNLFLTDNGAPAYVYMGHTGHFYDNGNLFWDLSKGGQVRFATDGGESLLTAKKAERDGFLHNPTYADPLFADAAHFDFTLAEDSPALALNFQPWDYMTAGTIRGSTVGFSLPGGAVRYNDHVTPTAPAAKKGAFALSSVLLPVLAAIAALALLALTVKLLLAADGRLVLVLGLTLFCALSGWFVYRNFVNWSPVFYLLGMAALTSAAALAQLLTRTKKTKPVLNFLLHLLCLFGCFFAVTLLLNNVLRIGEANAISATLTLAAVYVCCCVARFLFHNKETE